MIDIDLQRTQGDFYLNVKCQIDTPVVGLFGASGAGKSSLLSLIAGLITPSSGHLIINGDSLFDHKRAINVPLHRRRIGMVFQDSRLFPHLSVQDNLKYGFNLLPAKSRHLSFVQIVDLLEIEPLLTQKPHQLSGGEKQRVALGRALLTSPRLLLLDEPLASLDVRLKQQILPFLRRVKEEIEIPMIYVSHAIDEILYLTQEILLLEQGKLIAQGDFQQVMQANDAQAGPKSIGLDNVLKATVLEHFPEQGYTQLKQGAQPITTPLIQQAAGETVMLSIAADQIFLSANELDKISVENQLAGTVVNIKAVHQCMVVSVDIGAGLGNCCLTNQLLHVEVNKRALQTAGIVLGSPVYCLINAQAIRVHGLIVS